MNSKSDKDETDHQLLMLYRISRSGGWTAFFALVIAIGAAACAYLFWQQLAVTQDQLDTMQDLSSKLEKSLDIANSQSANIMASVKSLSEQIGQSTEAAKQLTVAVEKLRDVGSSVPLLTLDRPWVGVDSVSATPILPNQDFVIKASIRNGGRSPAIGLRMTFRTATPAASEIAVPNIEKCDDCVRSILLPNASITKEVTIDGEVFSPAKISRIKSGADKILLFGRIDYTDSADRTHTTTLCMVYAASGFSSCDSGNRVE